MLATKFFWLRKKDLLIFYPQTQAQMPSCSTFPWQAIFHGPSFVFLQEDAALFCPPGFQAMQTYFLHSNPSQPNLKSLLKHCSEGTACCVSWEWHQHEHDLRLCQENMLWDKILPRSKHRETLGLVAFEGVKAGESRVLPWLCMGIQRAAHPVH